MRARSLVLTTVGVVVLAVCAALPADATPRAPSADRPSPAPDTVAAITGGSPVGIGNFQSIVLVLGLSPEGFIEEVCTGTLIDPNFVVTAAHCVSDRRNVPLQVGLFIGVELFENFTTNDLFYPEQVYVNPSYDPTHSTNDVALLRLGLPTTRPPFPLMTPDVEPAYADPGTTGTAMGFGATDAVATTISTTLIGVQAPVYSDDECHDLVDDPTEDFNYVTGLHLCSGLPEATICSGDSGGPLVVADKNGTPRLAGVASFGSFPCGLSPGVFTRVSAQLPWINSVMHPGTPAPPETTPGAGYWMLGGDGKVYAFGAAAALGDATAGLAGSPAVSIRPTPTNAGFWVAGANGTVLSFGDAQNLGSVAAGLLAPGERVTSLAATPTGKGYYLFTTLGRVVGFGDALHHGDMLGKPLNGAVLGGIVTPDGKGYYMVGSDGGIFSFGSAVFHGSMGGQRLNAPVQALVPTADGGGYWLVASDGGIFAFGAPFRGSMGGQRLNRPIVGMVRYGIGYLMVASDGGIFNFSDLAFAGSLGANPPAVPIVAVAAVGG